MPPIWASKITTAKEAGVLVPAYNFRATETSGQYWCDTVSGHSHKESPPSYIIASCHYDSPTSKPWFRPVLSQSVFNIAIGFGCLLQQQSLANPWTGLFSFLPTAGDSDVGLTGCGFGFIQNLISRQIKHFFNSIIKTVKI